VFQKNLLHYITKRIMPFLELTLDEDELSKNFEDYTRWPKKEATIK